MLDGEIADDFSARQRSVPRPTEAKVSPAERRKVAHALASSDEEPSLSAASARCDTPRADSASRRAAEERKMKTVLAALAASALLATPALAATHCHDAHGKFVKCHEVKHTTTTVATTGGKCRDAQGHFAKCDAPGAHPAK